MSDPSLAMAFSAAAGELGMSAASWLFLRTLAAVEAGAEEAAIESLGAQFPVMAAVGAAWREGHRGPRCDLEGVRARLDGVTRAVVLGVESAHLDALVAASPGLELGLVTESPLEADFERILANFGGRVAAVSLAELQRWSGATSALVTFLYGVDSHATQVSPIWLRAVGDDTRTQFRTLLGWNVLPAPMPVYPRWLVEVALDAFTDVVP
ncbi:MAG: hypothetical protein JNK72_22205 [Myxococcales bacterium]|nr:hypothetical protein [Myxococcales bacterium]